MTPEREALLAVIRRHRLEQLLARFPTDVEWAAAEAAKQRTQLPRHGLEAVPPFDPSVVSTAPRTV